MTMDLFTPSWKRARHAPGGLSLRLFQSKESGGGARGRGGCGGEEGCGGEGRGPEGEGRGGAGGGGHSRSPAAGPAPRFQNGRQARSDGVMHDHQLPDEEDPSQAPRTRTHQAPVKGPSSGESRRVEQRSSVGSRKGSTAPGTGPPARPDGRSCSALKASLRPRRSHHGVPPGVPIEEHQ